MSRRTALSTTGLALTSLTAVLALSGAAAASADPGPAPAPAPAVSADLLAAPVRTAALPTSAATAVRVALAGRVSASLAGSTARTLSAAVDVDGVGAVLRRDADHALPPASTQKTFVVSAALLALGPDATTRTEVAATATVTAGALPGSLWLVAGGDPYLSSTGLKALAHAVRLAGVTQVQGDLRLDDSRYDLSRRNPGWRASWVPNQLGPLSALAVDRNAGRRDAAYLRDPALPNTARFRAMLEAEGVSVSGAVLRSVRPAQAWTVADRPSAPLSAVASRLLKASDNFAAEMLLKEVGHAVRGDGSAAAGVKAVRQVLAPLGVSFGPASDGSGLSAYDRQTTSGELALLTAMDATTVGTSLRAAMPVACVDGTLVRRMCRTTAAGNATAKTGTLSGVVALTGYATTRSGRTVRFAFQLTGVRSSAKARAAVDRAVVALTANLA